MGFVFSTRSSKLNAPKSSALQKSEEWPIIAVSALLKLAEWCESRVNLDQGGESCPDKEVCLPPPAPCGKEGHAQVRICPMAITERDSTVRMEREAGGPVVERSERFFLNGLTTVVT